MSAHNAIDCTVLDSFQQGLAIDFVPEGRDGLIDRVVVADVLVSVEEVVQSDLSGDLDAAFLCTADDAYALGGADELKMKLSSGRFGYTQQGFRTDLFRAGGTRVQPQSVSRTAGSTAYCMAR